MNPKHSFLAPALVASPLLFAVLYVASYAALVAPGKGAAIGIQRLCSLGAEFPIRGDYRIRGAERVFWPIEQLDHIVRPDAWGLWVDEDSPFLQRLCARG